MTWKGITLDDKSKENGYNTNNDIFKFNHAENGVNTG